LGSQRNGMSYYPWGEEKTSTPNGQVKFATYFRDMPGQDYADQRYYTATAGRFYTADPAALATADLKNPTTWNMYAYANDDPVNLNDPHGMFGCVVWGWTAAAATSLGAVSDQLKAAASQQSIFTPEQLDCISGIETGRTWNPNIVAKNGRVGLFQFNQANWTASGTAISWDNGSAAKNPQTAAEVTLALLYRKLGYGGVQDPTDAAIQQAIDNFGEGDGRYGKAAMDCAKQLQAGDFVGAYNTLQSYANWVAAGRP